MRQGLPVRFRAQKQKRALVLERRSRINDLQIHQRIWYDRQHKNILDTNDLK